MARQTAKIQNYKTGIMGTIEFDLKCEGHRGFQNFLFYPKGNQDGVMFTIQSDKRVGTYNAETGEIKLSKSRSGGSYCIHLVTDRAQLTRSKLAETDRIRLNEALAKRLVIPETIL